jgi:membrane fusion protein (multidrug efflux system)
MTRHPVRLLLVAAGLVLAGALAAWSLGPQDWRQAALGWLGVGPPERSRPPTRVRVAPVEAAPVAVTAESVGTLAARESVTLTAEVSGHVEAIHFREGTEVEAGALLVELDAGQQRARVARAEARLEEARLDLERARELRVDRAIAQAELDRLEAAFASARAELDLARADLAERRLRAPFTGRIGLRGVSPGSLVSPGTPIATLYAPDPLELRFGLSQRLLRDLVPGLPVAARSDAFPGRTFSGEIARIAPGVDPDTRSVAVEAELPNADGRLRPGLFMQVEVTLERRPEALVIPEEALLRRGDAAFVYVVGPDGTAVRRDVRIGERRPGRVEVREGLALGERVVTGGLQQVVPGRPVRVAETDGARPP